MDASVYLLCAISLIWKSTSKISHKENLDAVTYMIIINLLFLQGFNQCACAHRYNKGGNWQQIGHAPIPKLISLNENSGHNIEMTLIGLIPFQQIVKLHQQLWAPF